MIEEAMVGLKSRLSARMRKWREDEWIDLGVLGNRCVTTVFAAMLVDYLQGGGSGIGTFKYHDIGTGVGAESAGDTTLGTASGMARETGTQAEGSSSVIYQSVATFTNSVSGSTAFTEHGLFNAATDGSLLDRTVFGAITLDYGDVIEFTYELEVVAGG